MTLLKTHAFLKIITLLIPLIASSCGADYNRLEIKDYRLKVLSDDPDVHQFFYEVIQEYNERAGLEALSYVSKPSEANSTIQLIDGLRLQDKKVGWGQWIKETETSGSPVLSSSKPTRTITYSMKVEFDKEYMTSRMARENDKQRDEVFKLFAHEVGHGFLLDHHPDPENVMYFDVSGKKEYASYFTSVRGFFGR